MECLISLTVLCILAPLAYLAIKSLASPKQFYQAIQDETAMFQLKEELFLAREVSVSEEVLTYQYLDELRTIQMVNDKLIRSPGTLIFLTDIDEISFEEDGQVILLRFCRMEKCWRRIIYEE